MCCETKAVSSENGVFSMAEYINIIMPSGSPVYWNWCRESVCALLANDTIGFL